MRRRRLPEAAQDLLRLAALIGVGLVRRQILPLGNCAGVLPKPDEREGQVVPRHPERGVKLKRAEQVLLRLLI